MLRCIWDEITPIWASVSSGASATAAIELLASDPRVGVEAGEQVAECRHGGDANRGLRRLKRFDYFLPRTVRRHGSTATATLEC